MAPARSSARRARTKRKAQNVPPQEPIAVPDVDELAPGLGGVVDELALGCGLRANVDALDGLAIFGSYAELHVVGR